LASRELELEQARLLTMKAAWEMDTVGNKQARTEIAAIKVVAARVLTRITDRAMQLFGAAGVSADTPLAYFYAMGRQLRIVDGPDEVHLRTVAREEIRKVERPVPDPDRRGHNGAAPVIGGVALATFAPHR
jgi:acyl-CoA dehydrogenase